MNAEQFKARTRRFAVSIVRLCRALPRDFAAEAIGKQLLRSGTSVDANYRAACRPRSSRDMIAKLSIVEEEADESVNWLEILDEAEIVNRDRLESLHREGQELLAMTVASINTLKKRLRQG